MPFSHDDSIHQKVIKIAEMFALYRAELARVLHIRCDDITALERGVLNLSSTSDAGQQAERWLGLFEVLYDAMQGDRVQMCHWLRAQHPALGMSPLLHLLDNDGLADLLLMDYRL